MYFIRHISSFQISFKISSISKIKRVPVVILPPQQLAMYTGLFVFFLFFVFYLFIYLFILKNVVYRFCSKSIILKITIVEPVSGTPDVYIQLPKPLTTLRNIVERLRNVSDHLRVIADMQGKLRFEVSTDVAEVAGIYVY